MTSPITSPLDIPRPCNDRPAPRALIALLDGDEEHTGLVIDAIHTRYPRVPVGLVASEADSATALRWLRERRVDRLIPKQQFDGECGSHLEALARHGARLDALHRQLTMAEPRTLLVTGATGFLGSHFLRYLLRCGHDQVIALVRNSRDTAANERLAFLQRLYPGRITCIEGDISHPELGLTAADRELVADRVVEVWHLAAITKFEELLREKILQTNLKGTEHVLALAGNLPRLRHFYHVSTAYASGYWGGTDAVPEARLARAYQFKNPYEESKFLAEEAVVESGLPATIFRPSIILGESISGLCDGQTVYNVAKMIRLARLAGDRAATRLESTGASAFRVVVDPDATKNLIHVDDVVCRMLHIASTTPTPGSFFNLSHERPTSMTTLISTIAGLLGISNYVPVQTLDDHPLSVAESVLQRVSEVFRPYMLSRDPQFCNRRARCSAANHALLPVGHAELEFLLRSFFEQHYGGLALATSGGAF